MLARKVYVASQGSADASSGVQLVFPPRLSSSVLDFDTVDGGVSAETLPAARTGVVGPSGCYDIDRVVAGLEDVAEGSSEV